MTNIGLALPHNLRRVSSSSSEEDLPPPNPHRVKRALFGPTDHEENLRFVRNELKKARSEAASRWNFDFDAERPLDGRYSWQEVRSSSAVTAVLNPEKHQPSKEFRLPEGSKENRVSQADTEPGGLALSSPDSLLSAPASSADLKTPPQTATTEPSSSSSAAATTQPSLPTHGAISQTKEKKLSGENTSFIMLPLSSPLLNVPRVGNLNSHKITFFYFTEMFRSRKPRSKSSTKLKLKRLDDGGSSRSPSVKSRAKEGGGGGGVRSENAVKIPVTSSKLDDSNSSSD